MARAEVSQPRADAVGRLEVDRFIRVHAEGEDKIASRAVFVADVKGAGLQHRSGRAVCTELDHLLGLGAVVKGVLIEDLPPRQRALVLACILELDPVLWYALAVDLVYDNHGSLARQHCGRH